MSTALRFVHVYGHACRVVQAAVAERDGHIARLLTTRPTVSANIRGMVAVQHMQGRDLREF